MYRLFAVALLAVAPSISAQVFKCVDSSGKVTYQQTACDGTSQAGMVAGSTGNVSLGQRNPGTTTIDECAALHGYPRTEHVIEVRAARFSPLSDGSWEVAITAVVTRTDGSKTASTIRCPVTGAGVINVDLFRAQRALKTAEDRREALAKADQTPEPIGKSSAPTRINIPNHEKAGERRFLAAQQGVGQTSEQIRQRLGDPDEDAVIKGTCWSWSGGAARLATPYPCEQHVWTYYPAALDPQTKTVITFQPDGRSASIERTIER